jgi:hypothetical protein
MYKNTFSSCESGIGECDGEGSAVEDFFNKFVPRLGSLARHHDELLDDPTIDLDAMAVCKPPPQKKTSQQQKQQHQSHRPKMIMTENSSGNRSNGSDSGRDLSMDEIGLIVGQLRGGGPYSEKLVSIMLNGLEKTLTSSFYRLFLESGLPDNWCPIVKMNNDNTPFVEFLIKSDLSDQDPFSQLNEYSTEHMALCRYVVNQLHQNATRRQQLQLLSAPPKKKPPTTHHNLPLQHQQSKQAQPPQPKPQQPVAVPSTQPKQQQPQPKQQQQQQQQPKQQLPQPQAQLQQQSKPQQQQAQPQPPKPQSMQQQARSFGAPIACSTPKSQRQRILPPRACKSARNDQKH